MKIRDPIHVFIELEEYERCLLDCAPIQRLRHIHQLASTPWVYPGATHTRFEHSLGVLELATRIFDEVTKSLPANLDAPRGDDLKRWRCILRAAALFHDVGHLPFSHAAEKQLLPDNEDHETIGHELIVSQAMETIFQDYSPFKVKPIEVAKIAMGPGKVSMEDFSDWERVLSQIITANALGADRMDYLLRDSYHAGVAYGRFDHYRLIDSMRILELPQTEGKRRFQLGVLEGGLVAAEALLLARYQMYSQVYFHKTRRILDLHLKSFFRTAWSDKPGPAELMEMDDHDVFLRMREAFKDSKHVAHHLAERLLGRAHFRVLYSRNRAHEDVSPKILQLVADKAKAEFGSEVVEVDELKPKEYKSASVDFPVQTASGDVQSSASCSQVARNVPPDTFGFVFIAPEHRDQAREWLNRTMPTLLQQQEAS